MKNDVLKVYFKLLTFLVTSCRRYKRSLDIYFGRRLLPDCYCAVLICDINLRLGKRCCDWIVDVNMKLLKQFFLQYII